MNPRRLRVGLEFQLARLALAIVPRLSRRTILRLARILGSLGHHLDRSRSRRVAEENLALVFPEKSAVERQTILRASLQSFALAMLDVFWIAKDSERKLSEIVHFDPSYAPLMKPGPMVCVTAHMGNWEILGMAVHQQSGRPLVSVANPLKNYRVDALFNSLRQKTGQEIVARKGAVRSLMKALRNGDKIALVLDQNTKPIEGGVFVPFLGRAAPVSSAPALLALRLNVPIIVGILLPTPAGRYETLPMEFISTEGLAENRDAALHVLTQRIVDVLSAAIRANPEHWVWGYKRWKFRPADANAEDYPYYSRPLNANDLPRTDRSSDAI